jgi:ketosteroid isomerase-like protein
MSKEHDPSGTTQRFLDLLEAGDRPGIDAMLDDDVSWIAPMTATGDAEDAEQVVGKAAFSDRLTALGGMMSSARFVDRRVSATADGTTTFVQTCGDFRTISGRPYRNVYVFRFDWRNGRIVTWEEYANPVTILRAFPELAQDA